MSFATSYSSEVDELSSLLFIALEVLLVDEGLDLVLDHCGLGFECADAFHNLLGELSIFHAAGVNGTLHPFDSLALDLHLSLPDELLIDAIVVGFSLAFVLVWRW